MAGTFSNGGSPRTGRRDGEHVNLGRAFLVIVVGVVIGAVLLGVASKRPVGVAGTASGATATTTSVPAQHPPTTTTTTVPRSTVSVLVANGTTTANMAAHFTQVLQPQGWGTQSPVDTTTTVTSSSVYYAAGEQAPASMIATELGLTDSAVAPLTSSVPVSGSAGIDVVVVIGPDLAARATSGNAGASGTTTTVN